MAEKDIEAYLRKRVAEIGGKAFKFVSPGNNGVPDRLVCLPGGKILFAELKAPGKKPTALQEKQMSDLEKLGFECWIVDSKEKSDYFIRYCEGRMGK